MNFAVPMFRHQADAYSHLDSTEGSTVKVILIMSVVIACQILI